VQSHINVKPIQTLDVISIVWPSEIHWCWEFRRTDWALEDV